MHNIYYDEKGVRDAVVAGRHRDLIGGVWEEMGSRQQQFLVEHGLRPHHRLLDIGCGSLRLGVHAIGYLEQGHYFGTDISGDLIEAGYRSELTDALQAKAPRSQFAVSDDFEFGFLPQPVDVAIAQSVFTHLPLNHLRRCLAKLSNHIVSGGRFFVTFFECPAGKDIQSPIKQSSGDSLFNAGVVTYDYKDPYHYRISDLEWAADPNVWSLEVIGDWGHPRGQQMAAYVRRT